MFYEIHVTDDASIWGTCCHTLRVENHLNMFVELLLVLCVYGRRQCVSMVIDSYRKENNRDFCNTQGSGFSRDLIS